jgi:hypothetical protein
MTEDVRQLPSDKQVGAAFAASVLVEVPGPRDPVRTYGRSATIARRRGWDDHVSVGCATSATSERAAIRRQPDVIRCARLAGVLAIHRDSKEEWSTPCAARFARKPARNDVARLVSLARTRRLSPVPQRVSGFAECAGVDAARPRTHALSANETEKGRRLRARIAFAYFGREYTESRNGAENQRPARPQTVYGGADISFCGETRRWPQRRLALKGPDVLRPYVLQACFIR